MVPQVVLAASFGKLFKDRDKLFKDWRFCTMACTAMDAKDGVTSKTSVGQACSGLDQQDAELERLMYILKM